MLFRSSSFIQIQMVSSHYLLFLIPRKGEIQPREKQPDWRVLLSNRIFLVVFKGEDSLVRDAVGRKWGMRERSTPVHNTGQISLFGTKLWGESAVVGGERMCSLRHRGRRSKGRSSRRRSKIIIIIPERDKGRRSRRSSRECW